MYLEQEKIKDLLLTSESLSRFSLFFAEQELDRISEIIYAVFFKLDGKLGNTNDFQAWKVLVQPELLKGLNDARDYFGINDFTSWFPAAEFLQVYFQSLNVPQK